MAIYVSTDAYVTINSVNYSTLLKKVTVDYKRAAVETTAMGSTGQTFLGGLFSGSLGLDFNNDLAASGLYQSLWAIFIGSTGVTTFEVRGTSSAVGTSNPKFTGSVLLTELPPLDTSVGDLASLSVSWNVSGAVTLATA